MADAKTKEEAKPKEEAKTTTKRKSTTVSVIACIAGTYDGKPRECGEKFKIKESVAASLMENGYLGPAD